MSLRNFARPARCARKLTFEKLDTRDLLAADMVLDWNEQALETFRALNTNPPVASRALAIMHVAIYDAVNSLERTNVPYAVQLTAPANASREATVAAAAHQVLVSLFPVRAGVFDAAYADSLATIPNGAGETAGVTLGTNVANQILALRATDGSATVTPYVPGTDNGQWIPTPPGNGAALLPGWGNVTPFALTTSELFSVGEPPALTSAEYTAAFNEVKSLGDINSTTRTADQTDIARFWANGGGTATPPGHLNMLAAIVADARNTTLAQNARLFAMLNVALADAAIQCWDNKFDNNFWRPVTGIRAGDSDGNPSTTGDADWTPLLTTPPFPSYTSGHSSFSGAAAEVLKAFFGTDNVPFTLPSENEAVGERSFASFSQAAQESADSRLYAGIHWRFDNEDGLEAGNLIGKYVANRFFRAVSAPGGTLLLDGLLTISGTQKNDVILVQQIGSSLTVWQNGRQTGRFNRGAVESIVIDAGNGNDFVSLLLVSVPTIINGGAGNDTLMGGNGRDTLNGGAGHDFLYGMGGNDLLNGEAGDDWLFGGPGSDTFTAQVGRDRRFQ